MRIKKYLVACWNYRAFVVLFASMAVAIGSFMLAGKPTDIHFNSFAGVFSVSFIVMMVSLFWAHASADAAKPNFNIL